MAKKIIQLTSQESLATARAVKQSKTRGCRLDVTALDTLQGNLTLKALTSLMGVSAQCTD